MPRHHQYFDGCGHAGQRTGRHEEIMRDQRIGRLGQPSAKGSYKRVVNKDGRYRFVIDMASLKA
jgi:hypothetical protein